MAFPTPVLGLVIRYSYLWRAEQERGQEEGGKDRPCAVILTASTADGETTVTVLPVTHTPPADERFGVELPAATKRRLGLDDDRSWVVLTEANRFQWPGPDLRPRVAGDASSVAYGLLPAALIETIRTRLIALLKNQQASLVTRSE